MDRIGLIAGNGRLPLLFAQAARDKGLKVIAVAHQGETDAALAPLVDQLTWVKVGQVNRMVRVFTQAQVRKAVMAGGIQRVRAITDARPDLGMLRIAARARSLRDDALLRAIAQYFGEAGVEIGSPTELLAEVLAPLGHLAGPPLDAEQQKDLAVGLEVATLLGQADVGQTVVVRRGLVLALEAVEGTDETIRRAGKLGGAGATVVKLCKPQQDLRFDLPTVGPQTLLSMREAGARALVVEAGRTILLDAPELFREAERHRLSIRAVARPGLG